MIRTLIAAGMLAGALAVAAPAHADDAMYRVGQDIAPGDYKYTVAGNGMGSWETCADANCNSSIDFDAIDGMGVTGYLTVDPSARFLKTNDLILTPA